MKDFLSFVGGAVLGAAIGAGIIVFTTPKSGEETRQTLGERWNQALAMGKQAAREREQELWAEFNTRVKAPADMPPTDPRVQAAVDGTHEQTPRIYETQA